MLCNNTNSVAAPTTPATHPAFTPAFSPAEDRLDGVPAIAAFMGTTERVARYRLSKSLWPYTKEGSRFVASKRALSEHWRKATSVAAADAKSA